MEWSCLTIIIEISTFVGNRKIHWFLGSCWVQKLVVKFNSLNKTQHLSEVLPLCPKRKRFILLHLVPAKDSSDSRNPQWLWYMDILTEKNWFGHVGIHDMFMLVFDNMFSATLCIVKFHIVKFSFLAFASVFYLFLFFLFLFLSSIPTTFFYLCKQIYLRLKIVIYLRVKIVSGFQIQRCYSRFLICINVFFFFLLRCL